MLHSPEKVWRALTQAALIEEGLMKNGFQGASDGWPRLIDRLEGVAAGLP